MDVSQKSGRIKISQETAMELGHNYIGTEHLLLGLIKKVRSGCPGLNDQGMTEEKVIKELKSLLGGEAMRNN